MSDGQVSGVPENILESLEEGVEVILHLGGNVVIEVCARLRGEWCALLLRIPINDVAFTLSKINAIAPDIQNKRNSAWKNTVSAYFSVSLISTSRFLVPQISSSCLLPAKAACPAVISSLVPTCSVLIKFKLATLLRSVKISSYEALSGSGGYEKMHVFRGRQDRFSYP